MKKKKENSNLNTFIFLQYTTRQSSIDCSLANSTCAQKMFSIADSFKTKKTKNKK